MDIVKISHDILKILFSGYPHTHTRVWIAVSCMDPG